MSLANKLKQIYPDIDLFNIVRLADIGAGQYIEYWGDSRPQPTQAELDNAGILYEKYLKTTAISEMAGTKIAAIFGFNEKSQDLIIKELNYSNRCNDLRYKSGVLGLSELETVELSLLESYWMRVQNIRAYTKQLTMSPDLLTIDINLGWPE